MGDADIVREMSLDIVVDFQYSRYRYYNIKNCSKTMNGANGSQNCANGKRILRNPERNDTIWNT